MASSWQDPVSFWGTSEGDCANQCQGGEKVNLYILPIFMFPSSTLGIGKKVHHSMHHKLS